MLDIKIVDEGDKKGKLILEGKLDNNTAQELGTTVGKDCKWFDSITFDCKGLNYVSSAGIRVLKQTYVWTKSKGGSIELINVSDDVKEILDLTGVSKVFNVKS